MFNTFNIAMTYGRTILYCSAPKGVKLFIKQVAKHTKNASSHAFTYNIMLLFAYYTTLHKV